MLRFLWLIPLLPFAGALVNGLFGRRLPVRAVHTVACGAVLLALLLSLGSILDLSGGVEEYRALAAAHPERYELSAPGEATRFEVTPAEWIPFGTIQDQGEPAVPGLERESVLRVGWTFQIDALTAVMLLVVTGVGFLIHVYSIGYMGGDPGYARFFSFMNLFTGAMLTLVLGGNFLVMFVGWEGVGLCSYLLIGYYYDQVFDRESGLTCADAGRKAFIVNRIGDFAFLIGVLLVVVLFGTLDFSEVAARINGHSAAWFGSGVLTLIGILFFIGATGKSAQIPLYVWLPDAMAGPTPVSALIHAATMVTAGVYMLARTSALYWHAPDAMMVVAVVGCLTAIFAATMGLVQHDIKKVLAYSTVSQLGYMFLAAGVGAFVAAIFHLVTHAFFKACLFLGAGSVIHANHHTNDMRLYGGLRKWMPWTFRTYLVATLAIAGFPLLSGFFSKDEILVSSLTSNRGHVALWVVGSLAAVLTSFYMFRSVWMTFLGENRAPEEVRKHIHESPRVMTGVLSVLAAGAIVVGFLGVPSGMTGLLGLGDLNWFEHRVHP
ncbi:MAG: NADH-quinone oxidoreductase subunit L, partial [Myxococcota bacterium]